MRDCDVFLAWRLPLRKEEEQCRSDYKVLLTFMPGTSAEYPIAFWAQSSAGCLKRADGTNVSGALPAETSCGSGMWQI